MPSRAVFSPLITGTLQGPLAFPFAIAVAEFANGTLTPDQHFVIALQGIFPQRP